MYSFQSPSNSSLISRSLNSRNAFYGHLRLPLRVSQRLFERERKSEAEISDLRDRDTQGADNGLLLTVLTSMSTVQMKTAATLMGRMTIQQRASSSVKQLFRLQDSLAPNGHQNGHPYTHIVEAVGGSYFKPILAETNIIRKTLTAFRYVITFLGYKLYINYEVGSDATSALPELERTFDRKAVLQALRDKSPAGRDAVWGRYIVKIDAEIEQRQAEVLQDVRDITEKSWTAEERRKWRSKPIGCPEITEFLETL